MSLLLLLESAWSTVKCASECVFIKTGITAVPQWLSVPTLSTADESFLAVSLARTTKTKNYMHIRIFTTLKVLNASIV